jgi:chemotaxis protein MotB
MSWMRREDFGSSSRNLLLAASRTPSILHPRCCSPAAPIGSDLLKLLAQELGRLPNHIAMEGHTDSKPYPAEATYGNWELSADRANAARRLMQQNGIGADQVTQVRGFADQRLRKADTPLDPSNRRISLIVQYLDAAGP